MEACFDFSGTGDDGLFVRLNGDEYLAKEVEPGGTKCNECDLSRCGGRECDAPRLARMLCKSSESVVFRRMVTVSGTEGNPPSIQTEKLVTFIDFCESSAKTEAKKIRSVYFGERPKKGIPKKAIGGRKERKPQNPT